MIVEYLRVTIKPRHFVSRNGEALADREVHIEVRANGKSYHCTDIYCPSDLESWLDLYFAQAIEIVKKYLMDEEKSCVE